MSRFDSLYKKKPESSTVNQTNSFVEPIKKPRRIVFPFYYFYRSLMIVLIMWIALLLTALAAPWADYYIKKGMNNQDQQVLGTENTPKPTPTPVLATAPTFYLKKGDLEIEAPIVKGITDEDLTQGIGHHPDSAWPNQKGNVVLAGHSFSLDPDNKYGTVFENLRELEVGDEVQITYQSKKYIYKIFKKETVGASDMTLMGPAENWQLTFYTCDPPKTDWRRLVFQAELVKIE